jgi:hypothetical protein
MKSRALPFSGPARPGPPPPPAPAHTVRASDGHAQLLGVVFFFVELLEPALLALLLHLEAGRRREISK